VVEEHPSSGIPNNWRRPGFPLDYEANRGSLAPRRDYAADAVVEAGAPGVAVYVRDRDRTTIVTGGYDDLDA
jgi:hypothetical protein